MNPIDLDITKLFVAERIQLAEDLWASVRAETADVPSATRRRPSSTAA
jgi:hypothetical protein